MTSVLNHSSSAVFIQNLGHNISENAAKTRLILHQTLDCWVVTACGEGSNCNKWSLAGQNWHLPTFYEYKFTFWTPDSGSEMETIKGPSVYNRAGVWPSLTSAHRSLRLDTWVLISPRCPHIVPTWASQLVSDVWCYQLRPSRCEIFQPQVNSLVTAYNRVNKEPVRRSHLKIQKNFDQVGPKDESNLYWSPAVFKIMSW